MGIDFAIGRAREAIMFDHRSQAFCSSNNRWISNQHPDQHFLMRNTVEPFDGRNSPQGLAPASLSPGYVNHGGNLLLSTSSPTDTFDDLHGPTMDNGYGICQSPGLDSIYSNLGTPNSFITDCPVDSPRERLFSTSSSTYTYSPYNPHEERTSTPTIQRQASLEMVEEYFSSPCVTASLDDNGQLDSSSQGFATHRMSNTAPAEKQDVFVYDDLLTNPFSNFFSMPEMVMLEGSPQTDSTQTSNSGEDNTATTSCSSSSTPVFVFSNTTNIPNISENCHANPPLPRQISSLSDLINETVAPNSQDAVMVNDCVTSFGENTPLQTVNIQILTTGSPFSETQSNPQDIDIPVPQNTNVKTNNMQSEEDVSTVRRERNNAACRASRKRRKDKKTELENSVGVLEEENRTLQTQIDHLELECKRFKEEIFSRMGNASR